MEIQGKASRIDEYETRASGPSATSPPKAKVAPKFSRLPNHVGLIPDGNRRWARMRSLLPQYEAEQFYEALRWYARQDVTLGG